MAIIIKEKFIFDNFFKIKKITFKRDNDSKEITQLSLERGNSVAVLIKNITNNTFVFVKQYRAPLNETIYEIVAGMVDNDKFPWNCAIREVFEETGYKITANKLKRICTGYLSPGTSSEKVYIYYTEVKNSDKVGSGRGLIEENEYIEIVEIPVSNSCPENFQDAKTKMALYWYLTEGVNEMSKFKKYRRTNIAEMRPYIKGEDLSGISVSEVDNPKTDMGMIARNPNNHKDKWYVARKYFEENFELID